MKIAVEIGFIAVFFFADIISQHAQITQFALFKKQHAFVKSDALAIQYFLGNVLQISRKIRILNNIRKLFPASIK